MNICEEAIYDLKRQYARLKRSHKTEAAKHLATAIYALNNRVPLKPTLEADGYADGELAYDIWRCPGCDTAYEVETEKYKHCPNCGQAIDWGEEE